MDPRNPLVSGSVVVELSESSQQRLGKLAKFPGGVVAKQILLAFAPTQADFDRIYQPLIGQEVGFDILTLVEDARGQIGLGQMIDDVPSMKAPYVVISVAEEVRSESLENLVKMGLSFGLSPEDQIIATVDGVVAFKPFLGGWAAEPKTRKEIAEIQAAPVTDDTLIDAQVLSDDPTTFSLASMAKQVASVVASYGPTSVATPNQVIGNRRSYRATTSDMPFDLKEWRCTDPTGPEFKGPWKIKQTRAEGGTVEKPGIRIERGKGGAIKAMAATRTIALEKTVGRQFIGRYAKKDGSLSLKAVRLDFRADLKTRWATWGRTKERYQLLQIGGVKINLIGPQEGESLSGVYDLEIKVRVKKFDHDTDPTLSRSEVTYFINATRVTDGVKSTKRMYLESVGRTTPEGAIVVTAPGQCQIVVVDTTKPQIVPTAEPSVTAQ